MFKKTNYEWVIADIYGFGTVIRNNTTNITDFVPANVMQLETRISKAMPSKLSDSLQRQEQEHF